MCLRNLLIVLLTAEILVAVPGRVVAGGPAAAAVDQAFLELPGLQWEGPPTTTDVVDQAIAATYGDGQARL